MGLLRIFGGYHDLIQVIFGYIFGILSFVIVDTYDQTLLIH